MSTQLQIKRTTVTGRTPNTTSSGNSTYIAAGELAINLTDGKLFSSNGTVLIDVGSNLSSLSVISTIRIGANAVFANATTIRLNVNDMLTFNDGTTQNTAFRVYDAANTRIA
jgi:hypothetical protein